jgi:hypothetical protein
MHPLLKLAGKAVPRLLKRHFKEDLERYFQAPSMELSLKNVRRLGFRPTNIVDIGAYIGLVLRRHQSGEIDYTGSISKCGDRRVRTLLYEAANVMLTRYKGPLKLKDWAVAIARRSTMRKARIALARRLAIIMHAMLRHGTEFKPA